MSVDSAVPDVTDETFQAEVLEASQELPVVVDFWAPWCGPCTMLSPIIEKLAGEFAGQVKVVKLNTDDNPQAAMAFQIQGIPAVKAFSNGGIVAEFTGAQPEANVRRFFEEIIPRPMSAHVQRAAVAMQNGQVELAERELRAALEENSTEIDAIIGLASILHERGDQTEAEALLARVPGDEDARALKHTWFLDEFADEHAGEDLEGAARQHPTDATARYRWGVMLAAEGHLQEALDELLESVRIDRRRDDEAARKAMLAIFDIAGADHPLVREYQRRLSRVLF